MFTQTITYQAALIAGLFSFFSPCILPLIPGYFSFITGFSAEDLINDSGKLRSRVFITTMVYIAGFSFVFIALGASASFLGGFVSKNESIVRFIGGGIICILGLHLLGIIQVSRLNLEKRIHLNKRPVHLFGVFIIGMAFAAGWSPCIGPMLGSILIVAGNQETVLQGIILLTIYSAGLALPFILISFFISNIFKIIKRANNVLNYFNKAAGMFLIIIGVLLFFDKFKLLSGL